ncbi:hypothetical protein P22_3718 [Propionispora sp. 2/2-37]|uniref:spore coat associated protein CotJA n=1 Tax=Propionispora sp. 2/2-37 TaxID=1677858 RepID=UPI0006BB82CB|nr:spore coat associated protein CotJA [Propionispora sp. 2/2-37]CUH97587.1 hypothetical protein P22_3718 [Propionispora sp. 2/2-37]
MKPKYKPTYMPEFEDEMCTSDDECMEDKKCPPMTLAHSYVPWQFYERAFSPREALQKGTLFPELYGVYRIPK